MDEQPGAILDRLKATGALASEERVRDPRWLHACSETVTRLAGLVPSLRVRMRELGAEPVADWFDGVLTLTSILAQDFASLYSVALGHKVRADALEAQLAEVLAAQAGKPLPETRH